MPMEAWPYVTETNASKLKLKVANSSYSEYYFREAKGKKLKTKRQV